MIKDGAKLVETAQDVLEELGMTASGSGAIPAPGVTVEGDTERVLTALGYDPAGIDALTSRCGLPADVVSVALVQLELAGEVAGLPGGLYQRLR